MPCLFLILAALGIFNSLTIAEFALYAAQCSLGTSSSVKGPVTHACGAALYQNDIKRAREMGVFNEGSVMRKKVT